jgi:hypothetical protein
MYQGVRSALIAILRSPPVSRLASWPGTPPESVLSLVMLLHHLSVLRQLNLAPGEHH